jgi:hypothetical protein
VRRRRRCRSGRGVDGAQAVGAFAEATQRESAVRSGRDPAAPAADARLDAFEREVEQGRIEQPDQCTGERHAVAAEHDAARDQRLPGQHEQPILRCARGIGECRTEIVLLEQGVALGDDRQGVLRFEVVHRHGEAAVGPGRRA